MKKLLYLFLSFTLFISGIYAQDCDDVTASVTVTPSTCQSNGSITITFSGASADNLVSKQYSIKSTTGTISIGPVSTNVFSDLPPGNYNLEAAGYCNDIGGEAVVRTVNNVVITGSYQEPRLSFVAQSTSANTASTLTSRKSYAGCSTGLIVVLLENGNQTNMPTFTITSAPDGVTVPQTVNATKATSGSAAAGWRYLLDGTWPAGTYTVSANDGCYSAAASFLIDEVTTVPPGSASYSYFRPYNPGVPDCSKVYYLPSYSYNSTSYPDWYRYYIDGLYEYGIAPLNQTPKDWFRVRSFSGSSTSYQDIIDLGPEVYKDYYSSTSNLTLYTRVKNCPSAMVSANLYLKKPAFNISSSTNTCTGSRTYTVNKYSDYDGVLCYPLTITITDQLTGALIYEKDDYMSTDPAFTWTCNTGESFYRNITDASGYKLEINYAMSGTTSTLTRPTITLSAASSYPQYKNCNDYKRTYSTSSGIPCENESAFPCYVTITDNTGAVIKLDTLTSTSTKTIEGLEYGITYTFTAVYPNWDNYTVSGTSNLDRSTYIASSFTLSRSSTSVCSDNRGNLRVSTGSSSRSMKAGTTITITGPSGYVSQTYTFASHATSTTSGYYYTFPETYLPPGDYTATVVFCGETYTASLNGVGGYTGDRLEYTTERDCMGLKLFPSGSISNNGTPLSTVYFRMTSVPSGGDATKVIASTSSDSFLLNTPGTYILGMMTSNSVTGCAIKLDTIVYNPQPLALDKDKTSAYSCPDGNTGYLTLQATNGVLPYTYSVYDKTNTTLLYGPVTSNSEIDLGNFGIANELYTVRMSDTCGNSFDQQVTLVSLDRTALAYGQSPVCYGAPISINGFTVTQATYTWTGPNGFTSTEKNPVIPNATSVNEGWYKVKIVSQTCGVTVTDSIYIEVYEPVSIADMDGKTQEVTLCPYQALIIGQAATGGSGNFTYQWSYNSNAAGTGTWTNLSGETNPTFKGTSTSYMFTSTLANPSRRYLRLAITDASCGTFYLYYHTNVRACTFLVNPDLKSPASPQIEN